MLLTVAVGGFYYYWSGAVRADFVTANFGEFTFRNCLKTPVSSKTRVPGGPEAGKMRPFRRVMAAIPTLETPPSDFLDSFSTHSGE
jgi:hypothetical protein